MSKLIDEIVTLTRDGWRPYRGAVDERVYQGIGCPYGLLGSRETRIRPYWFARGDIFVCVGCSRKCSFARPAGFMPPLPLQVKYGHSPEAPYTLTPQEMVTRKHLLNVDETAYCLNISTGLVYKYIAEGRLIALKENPKRVRAADVAAMMHDFDE